MVAQKLTRSGVLSLAGEAKTYIVFDPELPGFGCRVTPKGAKSWIVEYRPAGGGRRTAKRRVTIGATFAFTPDQARKAAKDILARARMGDDEAAIRKVRRQSSTVSELVRRYLDEEVRPVRKQSTLTLYEIYLSRHVAPAIGSRLARDLTHSDLLKLHRSIGRTKPVTANRVLKFMSAVLGWGMRNDEITTPHLTRGISLFREQGKERFLNAEELARLGETLRLAETGGLPWDVGNKFQSKHAPKPEHRVTIIAPHITAAIRLLLLTGCRLREILHLKWSEIDFERGMLFLSDSKTGKKSVVLSSAALMVLRDLPKLSEYVVPGADNRSPRHDLHRPWKAITKHAQLDRLRLHDLRHSFAAMGASNGFSLPVIGKLLGHRNVETTNRYAHLGIDPIKIAADSIADRLSDAIKPIL